jgi:hypothetical protein
VAGPVGCAKTREATDNMRQDSARRTTLQRMECSGIQRELLALTRMPYRTNQAHHCAATRHRAAAAAEQAHGAATAAAAAVQAHGAAAA